MSCPSPPTTHRGDGRTLKESEAESTLFAFFMQMSNSGKSYSGFFGTCKPHDNDS